MSDWVADLWLTRGLTALFDKQQGLCLGPAGQAAGRQLLGALHRTLSADHHSVRPSTEGGAVSQWVAPGESAGAT